jgi:hypothetical protein
MYSVYFADAAQSTSFEITDPVLHTSTSVDLWAVAAVDVWNEAFDSTRDTIGQLADVQLSQKLSVVESYADNLLGILFTCYEAN